MQLFKKQLDPRCGHCSKSRPLNDEEVVCIKKGVMSFGSHCRSFTYDPLKRTPPRPIMANFNKLKDEDFQL